MNTRFFENELDAENRLEAINQKLDTFIEPSNIPQIQLQEKLDQIEQEIEEMETELFRAKEELKQREVNFQRIYRSRHGGSLTRRYKRHRKNRTRRI
jgi:predicted translin family RNA/ssDNA-binding protein